MSLAAFSFLLQQMLVGLHLATTHHVHVVEGEGDVAVVVQHAHSHSGHGLGGDHDHGSAGSHSHDPGEDPVPEEDHPEELASPATAPSSVHLAAALLFERVEAPLFVSPWSSALATPTSAPRAPPPLGGAPPRAPPVRA